MLTGLIRPVEIRTITVEGDSLADVHTKLTAQVLVGWEVTAAPVSMVKGSTLIKATGTIERRDGIREIEADTMTQLKAKVPDAWRLLSVRAS